MKTINLLSLILTALFWVMFMGRTVMLMLRGVKVFTMAKNGKAVEKLLELCTVPLMLLWTTGVAFSAFGKFPLPGLFVLPVLQWVGLGLCLVGLAIFLAALISFGSSWRVGIDPENCNRLVTSGAFAFSRNPIFLFMNIFFIGTFLIYPNLFFLGVSLCFAIGIHRQILNEEKFLRAKFGREYLDYCKKVRRYI